MGGGGGWVFKNETNDDGNRNTIWSPNLFQHPECLCQIGTVLYLPTYSTTLALLYIICFCARLADNLASLHPEWDDEKLYQEARRIVIGQMQHITYNEWLPIVLGPAYMAQWGLAPKDGPGHTDAYDLTLNPSVSNVFATAAFRFGHTLVANHLESYNRLGSRLAALPITHTQFAPYAMYDNTTVETFVRGLTTQPAQAFDTAFAPELTGHLFQEEGESFGMDLVALNIQRGRDHGLAGYMAWRALCDLPTVTSWKELAMIFPSMVVARLQAIYKSVDDIDIFVGGILEVSYTYLLVCYHRYTYRYLSKNENNLLSLRNLRTAHCWGQRFSVSLVINLHGEEWGSRYKTCLKDAEYFDD